MLKRVFIRCFRYDLMQCRWGRKLIGGKFYHLWPEGLVMNSFWSDTLITSCQTYVLKTEEYPRSKDQNQ